MFSSLLAKTGHEPLSGARLQTLRRLVPHLGVFGAAAGGTIISGALDVGKVIPHILETNHLTGAGATTSAFSATQLEAYARQDDSSSHDFVGIMADLVFDSAGHPEPVDRGGSQMQFQVETFPAGTIFSTWVRLRRPTDIELSFTLDVLHAFAQDGRLGGRIASGHGQVASQLNAHPTPEPAVSWRAVEVCGSHRTVTIEGRISPRRRTGQCPSTRNIRRNTAMRR